MRKVVWLLPLLWASTCAFARNPEKGASGGVLTLHTCITECLKGNPQLASEQFTLAAGKESIWKEKSSFYPQVNGQADLRAYRGSPTGYWSALGINDPNLTGTFLTKG